jgi:hypothetical protein
MRVTEGSVPLSIPLFLTHPHRAYDCVVTFGVTCDEAFGYQKLL